MNRRHSLKLIGLGLFSILPGAGRVWRVERQYRSPQFHFDPTLQDFLKWRLERHPFRFEIEAYVDLLKPHVWRPNMADTQRLVICDPPIIK